MRSSRIESYTTSSSWHDTNKHNDLKQRKLVKSNATTHQQEQQQQQQQCNKVNQKMQKALFSGRIRRTLSHLSTSSDWYSTPSSSRVEMIRSTMASSELSPARYFHPEENDHNDNDNDNDNDDDDEDVQHNHNHHRPTAPTIPATSRHRPTAATNGTYSENSRVTFSIDDDSSSALCAPTTSTASNSLVDNDDDEEDNNNNNNDDESSVIEIDSSQAVAAPFPRPSAAKRAEHFRIKTAQFLATNDQLHHSHSHSHNRHDAHDDYYDEHDERRASGGNTATKSKPHRVQDEVVEIDSSDRRHNGGSRLSKPRKSFSFIDRVSKSKQQQQQLQRDMDSRLSESVDTDLVSARRDLDLIHPRASLAPSQGAAGGGADDDDEAIAFGNDLSHRYFGSLRHGRVCRFVLSLPPASLVDTPIGDETAAAVAAATTDGLVRCRIRLHRGLFTSLSMYLEKATRSNNTTDTKAENDDENNNDGLVHLMCSKQKKSSPKLFQIIYAVSGDATTGGGGDGDQDALSAKLGHVSANLSRSKYTVMSYATSSQRVVNHGSVKSARTNTRHRRAESSRINVRRRQSGEIDEANDYDEAESEADEVLSEEHETKLFELEHAKRKGRPRPKELVVRMKNNNNNGDDGDEHERRPRPETEPYTTLVTKAAEFSNETKTFMLNFNGRASLPSLNNLQLVDKDDHAQVLFQLGKCSKRLYCCDFRAPFTPFAAFAMAISCLTQN